MNKSMQKIIALVAVYGGGIATVRAADMRERTMKVPTAEWKKNTMQRDAHEYEVYLQHAAPFYAQHSAGKSKLNLESTYSYACTANDSQGVQGGLLNMLLGQSSVKVNDLLFASKLTANGVVSQQSALPLDEGQLGLGQVDGFNYIEVMPSFSKTVPTLMDNTVDNYPTPIPAGGATAPVGIADDDTTDIVVSYAVSPYNLYLQYLAANDVSFKAVSHRVDNAVALTHKIGTTNLVLGLRVPLVYAKNRVKAELKLSKQVRNNIALVNSGNGMQSVLDELKLVTMQAANTTKDRETGRTVSVASSAWNRTAQEGSDITNVSTTPGIVTGIDYNQYQFLRTVVPSYAYNVVENHEVGRAALADLSNGISDTDSLLNIGAFVGPNTFMRRYGQNPALFVQDIFDAKNMPELGGSTSGIGDIEVSLGNEFAVRGLERAFAGIKVTIPTAQQVTTNKFFAPEIGNGGHAALGFFASALLSHSNWVNLHGDIDCDVFGSARVNARAPMKVGYTNNTGNDASLEGLMSFGERVYIANGGSFNDYDTAFAGIGDHVGSFMRSRGTAFHARIGNLMVSKKHRAVSMDVYYDMYAKLKDSYDDDAQKYNTAPLAAYSQRVAHTVGATLAYQFDDMSRASIGASHVLFGTNTPRNWNFSALLEFAF